MGKSSKKSVALVEAAPVSPTKTKNGKRDAGHDLNIQVPKKQKKELIAPVQKQKVEKPAAKENLETSSSDSSDSSDSEEDQKTKKVLPSKQKEDSSSEEESSDEEIVATKKLAVKNDSLKSTIEGSSSSDESSLDGTSSDEEPSPVNKQAASSKEDKEDNSSSEDESSSDEETSPVKNQPPILKTESSSEDESSSDEEPTPIKRQPIVVNKAKAESLSSSDEETVPLKKQLPVFENVKAETSSSEDDSSSDEENDNDKPPMKKAKVSLTKQESSGDESSEESDEKETEDEKIIPKKKNQNTNIEMVNAEHKSNEKQPKKPTTQTQGGTKTLFVGNLPFNVERSDVKNFFKEIGRVVKVRLSTHEDGSIKGYGHVEFAFPLAALKALKLNRRPLLGRKVKLELAHVKGAVSKPLRIIRPSRSNTAVDNYQKCDKGSQTIYVKGFVSSSLGEDKIKNALRAHFSTCGEVTRIVVPTKRTGVITGNAYIDMKDGFDKALQLNGSKVEGWTIVVRKARPRDGSVGDRFSNNEPGGSSKPNKPSITETAQGKKTVFDDYYDYDDE